MHADKYTFPVSAFAENKIIVSETHPINTAVKRNGNDILVVSFLGVAILQYIMGRLHHTNVKDSYTPFFIWVKCHR